MRTLIFSALLALASLALAQERTPAPAGAEVYIISPKNGAHVHAPVLVQFGLKGMGIAPAGVKFDNTGHHHLLIDTDAPADLECAAAGQRAHRALRQGADRDDAQPRARQAHPAAAVRRYEPRAAQPAGHVAQDHHHRGEVGART